MRSTKATRWLSGTLAALLLAQGMCLPAGAWSWGGWGNWGSSSQTSQVETLGETQTVQLQNGTAIIPADADEAAVRQALFDALVINKDGVDPQSLEWEYYCTGKNSLLTNDAWGSINGFTSEKKVVFVTTTFTHPALAANEDGDYQVRLAGTNAEVTLTKQAKGTSSITLNKGASVALPYDENAQVDYDALRAAIFENVVASKTPEDLSVDDVTIEYYAENVVAGRPAGTHEWVRFEGDTIKNAIGIPLDYPAISAGEQKIRVSYVGTDTIYGTSAETTVTIVERPETPYTLKETPDAVTLAVGSDMKVDYNLLETAIFNAVVASSDVIKADNVTVEYYYEGLTSVDSKWLPLEGKPVVGEAGWPAISAGNKQIRIYWPGNQQYAPTTIEATVQVNDREQVQFTLNGDGENYEVGMVFNAEQGYDYAATAKAIYNAVVASTVNPEGLTAADVTVEYNVDKTGITDSFKPLNETDATGFVKFGTGTWEIRISWAGNQTYRGNHVDVNVTTTDNRLASAVALKSGASFTYNMDANAMKQAIFDNVIDWTNSTLPAKETLSLNNFVIEYYGKVILFDGGIDSEIEGWAPIEGKSYDLGDLNLGTYPQMGAGENQSIRISYKGNADYRPSETTEGTVTVNKAKVSVKVNSTNIYADEQLPANFITTDPADEFDIYTIYAGVTSSVSTGVYLDLPDRYTNSAVLKLLDPIVEKLYGKSFTQMMNDGVTVGELRELFSTQELLDLLDKLNIDTGTFGQILNVINKLPGVMDSVRIGFGTPNRAGLYTVTAVTDSKNYETGVGFGFLLTKMRFSGPKLTWNQEINGGKLTAAEAQNFDFDATLYYDGLPVKDQSSVHYLYSGFTSSWRVYSSTTTAPTEPGRYVVTVCILGGNYMAAPITRSFQITK
ncbi:MAG: hypothetical protein MR705_07820 [Flintibacter sp.]|uniref:hypothetical protein n=1 Tax=Flintibacter sp. TaxID=1918624 RepID=UPI0026713245|nr:hypothetical protein [Flintibacter sp.]MCI6150323.1 hypothetical protein [Flintibacter sp.]MCI7660684.1 hypothetical protein [Flintibacter sp.]MDD7116179.1 hypothetical protein [Flintibacter sp.]MDY5037158.1 hypothetical protein [Lawsonibacter sp.]